MKYLRLNIYAHVNVLLVAQGLEIYNYIENFPTTGDIDHNYYTNKDLAIFNTFEDMNKHYIVLYVYYKDLKYTLINDVPKTEIFNFISNIGGILGLFLGILFLSFIEVFEIFFEIIFHLIKKLDIKRNSNTRPF